MSNRLLMSTASAAFRQENPTPLDPELRKIFGPPPLYHGESEEDYDHLHDRIRLGVRPTDAIEEIWVRDVADLVWETFRLRRLKAKLMEVAAATIVPAPKSTSADLIELMRHRQIQQDHAAGSISAQQKINAILDSPDIDRALIEAQALTVRLADFERIDQLITQAEKRRNWVIREIDRHRAAVAKRMGAVLAEIEDAEFEDVPATEGQGQT